MTDPLCPTCGAVTVPHCGSDCCAGRLCPRPTCAAGWGEGCVACEPPHPWLLEQVPGKPKRWCKPVTKLGRFRRNPFVRTMIAEGFGFEAASPLPAWTLDDLFEMCSLSNALQEASGPGG